MNTKDFPVIDAHLHLWDTTKFRYPWRDEITEIAGFPNVYCKLSSLATEADHLNWTIDDFRPYVDHLIKCFGFDRLVFASDWPVSSLAALSQPVWRRLIQFLKGVPIWSWKKCITGSD